MDDIPKVGTAGRNILVESLTEFDEYKKAMSDGFPGFSEDELKAIEEKYKEGMLREDIQNELKKKRWPLNINTIKHYIKVGRLPKAACCKREGKTMYFYPPEFVRHLNLVRFLLTTGKKSDSFAAVVKVMANVKYRDDVLLDEHDNECYDQYSMGFWELTRLSQFEGYTTAKPVKSMGHRKRSALQAFFKTDSSKIKGFKATNTLK